QLPVRAATLALMIGPDHHGKGYGTDVVRTLTRYGFLEMGLNRIEIRVWAFNSRARRVYHRAGYREEGIRRDAVFHDGEYHDEVILSQLRREWTPSRSA
ncbi:MAG TPA: GNAT family protein, partial [Lacisediminihabitans sp.]|uniref:GNAT family N-acetyltransferase n=1 Tax=Lacisediminihabitans sp. TaxID=2787631 RepID=UPI002EDA6EAF